MRVPMFFLCSLPDLTRRVGVHRGDLQSNDQVGTCGTMHKCHQSGEDDCNVGKRVTIVSKRDVLLTAATRKRQGAPLSQIYFKTSFES
jgi:hypothetical protein